MTYKRVTMRIETARALRFMLEIDTPMTTSELANEMGLTLVNAHRRALAMVEQKLIAREQRYLPVSSSRISGRTTIYFMWVTLYGKERLAEYTAIRARRPSVLKPAPTKAPTRPKVASQHVPNSVFDLARVYAQKK